MLGLRTLKSVFAVFLCFLIHYLFIKNGFPFYSVIAALLCMQTNIQNSLETGINRLIGTFIGGIFGIIILNLLRNYIIINNQLLYYALISLLLIPLIYIPVLINRKSTSYITCVVFLSIVINHSEDMTPNIFAMQRIIDTAIGVIISIFVNTFNPYIKPRNDFLITSDLDGTLLNSSKSVSFYTINTINFLIDKGMKFTIATSRTPATFVDMLKKINIKCPVICMNGSAIYDIKSNEYIKYFEIEKGNLNSILNLINQYNVNCFIHTIKNNRLYIYYKEIKNNAEKLFFKERKKLHLKTYIKGNSYENSPVIYIMLLNEKKIIENIYSELENKINDYKINITKYEDIYNKGYYYLEISNINASKKNGIKYINSITNTDKNIVFGDNENDLPMFEIAYKSFAVKNAVKEVKDKADKIINTNDNNSVAKTLKYYNYKK